MEKDSKLFPAKSIKRFGSKLSGTRAMIVRTPRERRTMKKSSRWASLLKTKPTAQSRRKGSFSRCQQALERLASDACAPFTAYASLLHCCCDARSLPLGRLTHSLLIRRSREQDHYLVNLLLLLYSDSNTLLDSSALFYAVEPLRNVFSWSIMIQAFINHGDWGQALRLYDQMLIEGILPDNATYVTVISIYNGAEFLLEGMRMHARILRASLQINVILETALINMYSNCGNAEMAHRMFDTMNIRNVVTWTTLIASYTNSGRGKDALLLFWEMQNSSIVPNEVTFISLLNACTHDMLLAEGKVLHACIIERRFEEDIAVSNALLTMYCKCNSFDESWVVFGAQKNRDIISWTVILTSYVQQGSYEDAKWIFQQMQLEGFVPDRAAFISMLDACVLEASLTEGTRIHLHVICSEHVSDVVLGTALIDMYGKCGRPDEAVGVFNSMPDRSLVTWNTIIATCVQQGEAQEALQLLHRMTLDDVSPDIVTFSSVLCACSHAGLVEEGFEFAVKMLKDYEMKPSFEHYNCLVGLLGRVGLLKESENLTECMPIQPVSSCWAVVLASCKAHECQGYGSDAADYMLELKPDIETLCIVLSNPCRTNLSSSISCF